MQISYNGEPILCEGDTLILDAGEFVTYQWNTGTDTRYVEVTESGDYYVSVTNEYGITLESDTLIVEVFPNPSILEQATDVSCKGFCDVSVSIENTNGYGISAVQWTGIESIEPFISGLCAEINYSYTLTDSNDCQATGNIYISEPDSLILTCTIGEILCFGQSAQVSCEVTGGTFPYNIPSEIPGDFYPGSYSFWITDQNNCIVPLTFELTEPDALSGILEFTDASLSNGPGSATITPVGGTPPYSIIWSTGEEAESIDSLSEGFYSVSITDLNNCQWEEIFYISYNMVNENLYPAFEIYPNPAFDFIHFGQGILFPVPASYVIYNSFGEIILSGNTTGNSVDVSGITPGLYFIHFSNSDSSSIIKYFVKVSETK
jgi:hypothetical protein